MQGLPSVAAGLFRFLDEEGVAYCLLGDARELPAVVDGDLELIVEKSARPLLPEWLKAFCDRSQLQFVARPEAAQGISSYLLSWTGNDRRPAFLRLKVRSDYLRNGRRLWTAAELLRDRVRASDLSQAQCEVFVAPAAKEFVRCLLSCIDRDELTDGEGEHLARQWRLDPEGAALQVARFWDVGREGGVILRAAVADQWEPVRAARNALYSALAFRNVPSPASWRGELRRTLQSWIRPSGMLIASLGPDAAGRREVIEALAARPLAPFDRGQSMRLRPHVMRPRPPGAADSPRKARGRLGTTIKLMMFAADYWIGYWLRVRPNLTRGTLLVSDSYFDDVLVNPRRYRMSRARAFARLLAPWIPQPALWLVFDAPADVLRARQGEATDEDFDRLRSEYRRVLRGRRNVVLLDASQPIESVIADAERAIVAQAARRTARRLHLPIEQVDNPFSAEVLLAFSRRNVPILSRLVRVLFNSDINCRIPSDIHLPHPYGIVIQAQTALGHRVTIMQQATIGAKDPADTSAPIIGDDVYIGAGARVLGDVRIGDRVVVGANAVVTRDVPAGSTVVGANRIIAGRLTLAAKRGSDGSVTRFPVGVHRAQR